LNMLSRPVYIFSNESQQKEPMRNRFWYHDRVSGINDWSLTGDVPYRRQQIKKKWRMIVYCDRRQKVEFSHKFLNHPDFRWFVYSVSFVCVAFGFRIFNLRRRILLGSFNLKNCAWWLYLAESESSCNFCALSFPCKHVTDRPLLKAIFFCESVTVWVGPHQSHSKIRSVSLEHKTWINPDSI
jgi:hypothetical protein